MEFKAPKGTIDYYGEKIKIKKFVENKARKVFDKWGYSEIITPAFEEVKLLTLKSGQEISESLFYVFTPKSMNLLKKGESNVNKLIKYGLRFDGTVPVCRVIVNKGKEFQKPIKWYYIIPVWRYEETRGTEASEGLRLREFWQAGVELLGSSSPVADAEIIAMSLKVLEEIGLKNAVALINSRGLIEGLLKSIGIKEKKFQIVLRVIDKLAKKTKQELEEELEQGGVNKDILKIILNLSNKIENSTNEEAFNLIETHLKFGKEYLNNMREIFSRLNAFGIQDKIKFDIKIVRGLDYYSGVIFELSLPNINVSLGGGGRYDKLIEMYGGEKTPATGFGLGLDRINYVLRKYELIKKTKENNIFIIPISKSEIDKAIEITQLLRNNNFIAEISLLNKNLSKNLDYANSKNFEKIIIIGEKDLKNNEITLKNMNSGKETKVKINELINYLNNN